MHRLCGIALLCALPAASVGCSPPVPRVVDGSRIGWDQLDTTPEAVASLRFVVYVDPGDLLDLAAARDLQDVSCQPKREAPGFECSGKLPPLPPGPHTLQLASVAAGDTPRSSKPSVALKVVVVATPAPATSRD